MSIKSSGRSLRVSKPLKIRTFIKMFCTLMVLGMFAVSPAFAESARNKTSSTSSVTAMALIMALGLRNVPGPVERAPVKVSQKQDPPSMQRQALLLPCDKGCAPARSNAASQPRMPMEK